MPALTPAQREAVEHPGGPLLILGGAGTGKTTVLAERFVHLAAEAPPESLLVLCHSTAAADAMRARLEDRLAAAYEELAVTTFHGFCARLLHDEALEAGLDPFATPVGVSDRLAMLLEKIDELPLRHHDLRGNPSATLGAIVQRIDRLKDELVSAADYDAWAAQLPEDRAREREFAALYAAHEQLLADAGALDVGDLVLHAFRILRTKPRVRERLARRHRHVLVDELQDASFAQGLLLRLLAGGPAAAITAAADDDQSIHRFRGAATKNIHDFRAEWPSATVVQLTESKRAGELILRAAHAVVEPIDDRLEKSFKGNPSHPPSEVAFWRCTSERAQAQAVAAEVERLVSREDVAPEDVCVLVRSVRAEGQAVAVAFEERAVPYRLTGAAAFFQRAEVRDLLAWLRLLIDPGDAGAVVRALARPPVELRAIDLARVTQIARRRKLDMVAGLAAALESPQIPPEARERITNFLRLHRAAAAAIDSTRPDLYVHRLIERLGLRRQLLFAASTEVVERLQNLARFAELAAGYAHRTPQATARDFARSISAVAEAGLREEEAAGERPHGVHVMTMHAAKDREFDHVYVLGLMAARMPGPRRRPLEPIPDDLIKEAVPPDSKAVHAAEMRRLLHVAMTRARKRLVLAFPERSESGALQQPSPFAEEARAAVGGDWETREEELFGPAETLQSTFRMLRDELLTTVAQVGGRLGELKFDTDLDVSHAVVRYLELVKLAALLERTRAGEQEVGDLLPEINARLLQAVTGEQREIFETARSTSTCSTPSGTRSSAPALLPQRNEPSLESFLPRRGDGLMLSASDIETYRTCPLKYKFARVFRIPSEPTMNQRFGILVHQVLERYHAAEHAGLPTLLNLLEAGWRRGGFGDSEEERQFRAKATQALVRYHDRFVDETAEPVWFERAFQFRMGPHVLRGRVDRVDKLPDGGYELIDYKTGRPKSVAQLRDDIQLSLYAIGAREAWELDAAQQAYYYVLDDAKVPVPRSDEDRNWITETVLEVADGILGQGFEPTPSFAACSMCDYRIACPAAER